MKGKILRSIFGNVMGPAPRVTSNSVQSKILLRHCPTHQRFFGSCLLTQLEFYNMFIGEQMTSRKTRRRVGTVLIQGEAKPILGGSRGQLTYTYYFPIGPTKPTNRPFYNNNFFCHLTANG